ncbi:MAG: PDZ domain-containing protein [Planctomycetota bacterium]
MGIRVTMCLAVIVSMAFLFNSYVTPPSDIQAHATTMKKVSPNKTETGDLPPTTLVEVSTPQAPIAPTITTPHPASEDQRIRERHAEIALNDLSQKNKELVDLVDVLHAGVGTYRNFHGVSFANNISVNEALTHLDHGHLDHGVMVGSVLPNSPAEKYGLKVADLVLEAEGREVRSFQDILAALQHKTPEEFVTLMVLRNNQTSTVAVRLEAAPSKGEYRQPVRMGISMDDTNGMLLLREQLGFEGGLWVHSVAPESPAAADGLRVGDIITTVNGITVHSTHHLAKAMGHGTSAQVSVIREGTEQSLRLRIPAIINP